MTHRRNNQGSKRSEVLSEALKAEAGNMLLHSVGTFLQKNGLEARLIRKLARSAQFGRAKRGRIISAGRYRDVLRVYEEMGSIVATWYSNPLFLDINGSPAPLTVGRGPRTIQRLVSASGAKVPVTTVADLMRMSPTIEINPDTDELVAISRFFSLPGFELLRAGLVVERFLETLHSNSEVHGERSKLIFERSCYANSVGLRKVAKLLRDIKARGTAFMDSVDGQIEVNRSRKTGLEDLGELGVFMFAWRRSPKRRRRGR